MPAKLKFKLVYCSSEDPEFPSSELNAHSPHTVGWQSSRFCEYPQELGFQFGANVKLSQLQILSHQFKIATKLELFVGSCPDSEKPSYHKCKFKRLGYLSLDSNERSSWQARELKSVQLDAYGRFVKILVHKNHMNKLNMYSQVGVIAVNVIGDAAAPPGVGGSIMGGHPSDVGGGQRPAGKKDVSPLDDITFDLNFDPATAKQIRELHMAKERAVKAEDYDAAKRLKDAIDRLKQVGARMAKLELRKKAAVENEDYDTAKQIKVEIDKLRNAVAIGGGGGGGGGGARHDEQRHDGGYGSPQRGGMGGGGGMVIEQEGMAHSRAGGGPQVKNPFPKMGNAAMPTYSEGAYSSPGGGRGAGGGGGYHAADGGSPGPEYDEQGPREPSVYGGSPHKSSAYQGSPMPGNAQRAGSIPHGSGGVGGGGGGGAYPSPQQHMSPHQEAPAAEQYLEEDDVAMDPSGIVEGPRRILDPDHRMIRSKNVGSAEGDLANDPAAAAANLEVGAPEPLEGAVATEAEGCVELFGDEVARMVYSKQWQHREEGLKRLLQQLHSAPSSRSAKVIGLVNKKSLNDKNPAVYMAALNLFRAAAKLKDESGRPLEVKGVFDPLMPLVIAQLSNNNVRVKDDTARALVELSQEPSAGCAYVSQFVTKPPKLANAHKVIMTRLEIIEQLMDLHEAGPGNGLTPDTIMPMCVLGMNSSNADTRNKGMAVTHKAVDTFGRKFDPYKGIESDATKKILKERLGGAAPPSAAPPPARAKPAPPPANPAAAKKAPLVSPGGAAKGASSAKKAAAAAPKAQNKDDDVEPDDDGEKAEWYRRKAEQGDADAQYNLAVCYDEGKGVAQDLVEAAKWFGLAAEQGDGDAQFSLGVCYHEGKGVPKDDQRAIELWTKSAKQDNADAQFILGWSSNEPPE